MFLASLVCRAKDCRSGRTKAQGGTIGGKQNGNLWFCGIFSNVGSRPGPFFFFFLLSLASLASQGTFPMSAHFPAPFAEPSAAFGWGLWHPCLGWAGSCFHQWLGRKLTVLRCRGQPLEPGPPWFQASLIKLRPAFSVIDTIVAACTLSRPRRLFVFI